MTKTDWTAAEVRAQAKLARGFSEHWQRCLQEEMLNDLAERIEADESAVPVATVGCHWVGDALGFDLNDISEPLPPYGAKLFTHPSAQPAQEQPGWKVPEGEVRLWDTQWMDIVNHDNCYRDWDKTDAINHAVKMTEQAIARNVADGKLPPAHKSASPTPPKEK